VWPSPAERRSVRGNSSNAQRPQVLPIKLRGEITRQVRAGHPTVRDQLRPSSRSL